jgi:ribonuclease III
VKEERIRTLKAYEAKLQYRFRDLALLDQALTHRSYAHEKAASGIKDNERLEFLGDAVLELCVSDLLMRRLPDHEEGDLTKLRAAFVNERPLAELARRLDLGAGLLLGKGEAASGGRTKPSLLADAMEAVIAAVYLDGTYLETLSFIGRLFSPVIAEGARELSYRDCKSALQEVSQERFRAVPRYTLAATEGPEHDKVFEIRVDVADVLTATGRGRTKKEAEQEAARMALIALNVP